MSARRCNPGSIPPHNLKPAKPEPYRAAAATRQYEKKTPKPKLTTRAQPGARVLPENPAQSAAARQRAAVQDCHLQPEREGTQWWVRAADHPCLEAAIPDVHSCRPLFARHTSWQGKRLPLQGAA